MNAQKDIIQEIEEQRLGLYDHIERIHYERLSRGLMNWEVKGRRAKRDHG